jgi:hypothetical protein
VSSRLTIFLNGKPESFPHFFPTGNQVRLGVITPAAMTKQDVEILMKQSIEFGDKVDYEAGEQVR